MGKKSNKRPQPLVSRPIKMTSRKRARKVTTMFHKLTKERDQAIADGNKEEVSKYEKEIDEMGGREEYQRASQLSTSFHSTSKWVIGHLKTTGWLYGIKEEEEEEKEADVKKKTINTTNKRKKKKRDQKRRNTRVLEVGAINTELLDAAEELKGATAGNDTSTQQKQQEKKFRLDVRAIDINSMDPRIEEHDFLDLPYPNSDINQRYDAIVCSMVINCVTNPKNRGKMLFRLYNHLRPGGLCFLTLPLFCLTKSAFLTYDIFTQMLASKKEGVGFDVIHKKNSPRLAFFILRRPIQEPKERKLNPKWKKRIIRNKGKKFPNQFCVILASDVEGEEDSDEATCGDNDSDA